MSDTGTTLRSLRPEYLPDEHGEYVRILMAELQRPGRHVARNIALTGHYGSGKSSVLVEVERRLKNADVYAINLSLPSLGIGDARLQTPRDNTTLDTTNLIQKEIVKQLLYRRKPSDTPASRYNRLDTFQRKPAIQRAAGLAAALTGLALLAGLPEKVKEAFPNGFWSWLDEHLWGSAALTLQWLSLAVIFGLSLGALVWAQRLFHQRLRLTELAAGPAKVTLSDNSTSFFDEYLDEIVYFFQNSGTTVVIFEDLDRFEDPHIFETLRELNLLLNNAEQTGDKPIRFVYAIRDSIFEKLDEVEPTDPVFEKSPSGDARRLMSTNRTKFFDLVLPIVPFISHKTSRELIKTELRTVEEAQRPSPELVDLVSGYLTDMRLIKNICNEYDVFRPRILGPNGLEGLTPDRLFASIVYKNVYMADYEDIRVAESALDDLYRAFRDWVSARAAAARLAERDALARLSRVGASAISARSRRLGERLQAVMAAKGPQTPDPQSAQLIHAGTSYPWPKLLEADFWRTYLKDPQDLSLVYRPRYGAEGGSLSFDAVQTLMNERLSKAHWETADRAELRRKMSEAASEQRVVMHASLTYALQETDKLFDYKGDESSLAEVADQLFNGEDNALARELLHSGYIDENFALYVTQFPGQGSASAMNFILKAVQPDIMDIEYHFGSGEDSNTADIDAVLQAESPRLLQGKSVYNIEIFDHLLDTQPSKLEEPIRRLATTADTDRQFIEAYLSVGQKAEDFVTLLSASWDGIFDFLIGPDPEAIDPRLLDAAILGADPDTHYELGDDQRDALIAALPHLSTATKALDDAVAKSVARLFEQLDVRATDIGDVVEPLRGEMVARNLYDISRSNLITIVGDDVQLPLDVIKAHHDEIYEYMLTHPSDYITALDGPDQLVTVSGPANFTEVLLDVAKTSPAALTDIATRAADGCLIADLSVFDAERWSAIARAQRLKLTVPLVTQYLAELGLDDELLECLSTARRFDIADGDTGRLELAMAVVNASALDADTKIALLESLSLSRESITASAVEAHAHALIPRLVSGGWIADDDDAFTCLGEDERSTKQALISVSEAFPEYMTSLTLTPNDLLDITSADMPDSVKEVLLREYDTFEPTLGRNGARNLATWIASKNLRPEGRVILSLARKGESASAHAVVKLLGAQATTIDLDAMKEALQALGDPYARLTEPGRDRPKVPIIEGMQPVLQRLKSAGIVSKYVEKPTKSVIEVSKRHS